MSTTTNVKIENIKTKIEQLENERKRLVGLQKQADRKARTKRLIERGAILESFIPDPAVLTNDQIKLLLEKTITTESAKKILVGMSDIKEKTESVDSKWKVKTDNKPNDTKITDTKQGTD